MSVSPTQVFEDAKKLEINTKNSYLRSYPHFIRFFETIETLDVPDIINGAHMVYGWMPRVLNLGEVKTNHLDLFNRAKNGELLDTQELAGLKILVNNSIVGLSKLLHFISPKQYAIYDSRVLSYWIGKNTDTYKTPIYYLEYLSFLRNLKEDDRFTPIFTMIQKQLDYEISAFRAVELVMFEMGGK